MTNHWPLYDPPLTEKPLPEYRQELFDSHDRELYLHIGHFVTWYAAAEFMLTILLHTVADGGNPTLFHALTKGMDGKVKVERIKALLDLRHWEMDKGLEKRLEHFQKVIVPIRNQIAHSHPYWPQGGDLQLTSIGEPPIFEGEAFPAPPPKTYKGIELFERGVWLGAFAHDIQEITAPLPHPLGTNGKLGKAQYRSGLPTGHHQPTGPKASHAKSHARAQKRKRDR